MRVVACISLANTGHSYLLKSGLKIKAKEGGGWASFLRSSSFFARRAVRSSRRCCRGNGVPALGCSTRPQSYFMAIPGDMQLRTVTHCLAQCWIDRVEAGRDRWPGPSGQGCVMALDRHPSAKSRTHLNSQHHHASPDTHTQACGQATRQRQPARAAHGGPSGDARLLPSAALPAAPDTGVGVDRAPPANPAKAPRSAISSKLAKHPQARQARQAGRQPDMVPKKQRRHEHPLPPPTLPPPVPVPASIAPMMPGSAAVGAPLGGAWNERMNDAFVLCVSRQPRHGSTPPPHNAHTTQPQRRRPSALLPPPRGSRPRCRGSPRPSLPSSTCWGARAGSGGEPSREGEQGEEGVGVEVRVRLRAWACR